MAEVNQERRLARGQSAANNSCGVCVPKGTSVLPHPGNIREHQGRGKGWGTVLGNCLPTHSPKLCLQTSTRLDSSPFHHTRERSPLSPAPQ